MSGESGWQQFDVKARVTIRACREEDLPLLEWFGMFTAHREIIRAAFEAQRRGEGIMLVAEANHFPVGQAWVDLVRKRADSVAVIWAVRVLSCFQNLGIGTRIIRAAELALAERGFAFAELGVEKNNPAARRLYERLGYRVVGEDGEEYGYTTPEGERVRASVDEWLLRKEVGNYLAKGGLEEQALTPS